MILTILGWMSVDRDDINLTPTPQEVELMACVLEGRHGVHAEDVASFISELNANKGDTSRSGAWAAVSLLVRQRQAVRMGRRANHAGFTHGRPC